MINVYYDSSINRIILETTDPTHRYFLETVQTSYEYVGWKKSWAYIDKTIRIYDNTREKQKGPIYRYVLGCGWLSYVLGVFRDQIPAATYQMLVTTVLMSPNYRTIPFPNLRDYQNDDVLFLLKYRTGLFACQTGYGKSMVIATLADYFHTQLGLRVLLVTPSNKARDELVKRCKNVFGLDVSDSEKTFNGKLDCLITGGLMNSQRVKDPFKKSVFDAALASYDIVMADEVEYTINAGGQYIYDHCIGAQKLYGFSGTADKESGQTITFANGLSDVVLRNKDLVKYFGPSLIYRLPLDRDLNMITVKTQALDDLVIPEMNNNGNVYMDVMNAMWTDPGVCQSVVKVVEKFPMTFIPINNLSSIINEWIDNYFIGKFRTLLICGKGPGRGDGYIYWDLAGNKSLLTLDQVCDYAKRGIIDVIPSTSSGYKALDIPELSNILLIQGKVAGVVLQCVGRTARMKTMNIITLMPKGKKKIPVYSKGMAERDEQIKTFYTYCNIQDQVIEL